MAQDTAQSVKALFAELTVAASNLERYPFTSATMAEAGRLAANAIRNVVDKARAESIA